MPKKHAKILKLISCIYSQFTDYGNVDICWIFVCLSSSGVIKRSQKRKFLFEVS